MTDSPYGFAAWAIYATTKRYRLLAVKATKKKRALRQCQLPYGSSAARLPRKLYQHRSTL